MKCNGCKRDISTAEAQKMVTEYVYPDGHTEVTIPSEGTKATPGGRILHAFHYKHYKVAQKVARRTADSGSLIGTSHLPSAYEVGDLVMNRDEAADRGLSLEEAAQQTTAEASKHAQATLHQSLRRNQTRVQQGVSSPTNLKLQCDYKDEDNHRIRCKNEALPGEERCEEHLELAGSWTDRQRKSAQIDNLLSSPILPTRQCTCGLVTIPIGQHFIDVENVRHGDTPCHDVVSVSFDEEPEVRERPGSWPAGGQVDAEI